MDWTDCDSANAKFHVIAYRGRSTPPIPITDCDALAQRAISANYGAGMNEYITKMIYVETGANAGLTAYRDACQDLDSFLPDCQGV
jgi:hypothetical protein